MRTTLKRLALIIALTPVFAAAETTFPAETLREDFRALYAGLESAHYNLFINRSKEEYDTLFKEMLAELDEPMTLHDANVLFQRFAAYGNVAHARIEYDRSRYETYREAGGGILPLDVRIVDGRSYIAHNYSDDDALAIGSEITAINNTPMEEWLALTARHVSADTPYIAHSLLEFWLPMYMWEETGAVEQFRIELYDLEGQTRTVTVPAASREAMRARLDDVDETFSLDITSREARMLDGTTAYLRPGPFYNVENLESPWDATAFIEFVDSSFREFIDAGAEQLIVDLRQNPGGDNSFSDPMVAWFATKPFRFASTFLIRSSKEAQTSNQARLESTGATSGASVFFAEQYAKVTYGETFEYPIPEVEPRIGERFGGDVYVLVNRRSYSNAANVAAMVQDYGFGAVIGEKTSDMATTYGSMETFALPNTGIVVGFPKSHIIRPSGELRSDGVTPDLIIRTPIVPSTEDVVLQEALGLIRARD